MYEVIVVHVLCVKKVAVLFLAQVLRIDAIGTQEFLICYTEGLANGLCYELGLRTKRKREREKQKLKQCINKIFWQNLSRKAVRLEFYLTFNY